MATKKTASKASPAPSAVPETAPIPETVAPALPPPPVGRFEVVAHSRIRPAPWNPRKYFDQGALEELAASIRVHNIGEPLLVRSLPDTEDLELVAGERRHRAAELAGLAEVPVVIRDLTDEQAFDLACIENGQRVDLHPLEEADAFAVKRDRFHRSIDEVAAQVAHTPLYVRQRLKLAELCEFGRNAFFAGGLTTSTAMLFARMPDAELQKTALGQLRKEFSHAEGPLPYHEVRRWLEHKFMLQLGRATFDVADVNLVPAAGACTSCPKRTGNQRELFADLAEDVCTDPPCFQEKTDAGWEKRRAEAKTSGVRVISPTEAKTIWKDQWSGNLRAAGLTNLADQCHDDRDYRTYRELLKKTPAPVIARHPHTGAILELAETKDLKQLLKTAGVDLAKKKASSRSSSPAQRRFEQERQAERRKKERTKRVVTAAMLQLVPAAEKGKAEKAFLKILVEAHLVNGNLYGHDALMKRRAIKGPKDIKAYVDKLTEAQLRGLVLEVAIGDGMNSYKGDFKPALEAACALFKVDLKKLEAAELAADRQKQAAAAKATAKGGKKAAATSTAKKGGKGKALKASPKGYPVDDQDDEDEALDDGEE